MLIILYFFFLIWYKTPPIQKCWVNNKIFNVTGLAVNYYRYYTLDTNSTLIFQMPILKYPILSSFNGIFRDGQRCIFGPKISWDNADDINKA